MKKILVAALATAFAAPAASYAATSNVDIYGRIAATYNVLNTDTSVPAQDKTLYQVSSDNSYLGFKGNEDLGGGLKAIWQIELGFNADGGNNNLSNGALGGSNGLGATRNTFVGLSSSDFGTILLGKHDTPYKMATGKLDVFSNEPGDYRDVIGNVGGGSFFAQRPGNVIAYVTPNFAGFSVIAAYVAGNEVGNGSAPNADAWSVAGMYNNGPIYATVAYERHNNITTTGADDHAWKAGVGYDFGPGKVGLIYEDATIASALIGGTAGTPTGSVYPYSATNFTSSTTSRSAVMLDGAYNVTGNIVVKAAWGHLGSLGNSTLGSTGANVYTIGGDYVFSKRTKLIAQYQKVSNNSNGNYGVGYGTNAYYTPVGVSNGTGYGSYSTTGVLGNSPSIISVGLVHTF